MSDLEIYWAHERGKLIVGVLSLVGMALLCGVLWLWFTFKEWLDRKRRGIRPPAPPMPPKPPRERL